MTDSDEILVDVASHGMADSPPSLGSNPRRPQGSDDCSGLADRLGNIRIDGSSASFHDRQQHASSPIDTTSSPIREPIGSLPFSNAPTATSSIRLGSGSLRLRQPRPYDGRRTGTACEDWISEMRDYIEFYTIRNEFKSETERIQTAASYLTERARKVWNVRKRMHESATEESGLQVRTLEDFFKVIKNACTDFNLGERVRRDYNRLRQTKSVGEFAYDLLDLVDQLPHRPPDFEILERFRSGLRDHVTDELDKILEQPEELVPFIELCDRIDRKWWLRQRQRQNSGQSRTDTTGKKGSSSSNFNRNASAPPSSSSSNTRSSHSTSTGPTPQSGYRGRQRVYQMSGGGNIKKGTKEWKDWCENNRLCFKCGSDAHKSRNCTARTNQSNQSESASTDNVEVTFNINADKQGESSGKGKGRA